MVRAALFVLVASSAFAGAAQAQQICCVATQPPPPPCCMRGPVQPGYPSPQYTPAQYAPPQYAPPAYPDRPAASGLRGYVGVEYGKARLEPGSPGTRVETWTGEGAVSGEVNGIGVQGDLKVANFDAVGADDDTAWSPTLHAFKRNAYGLIGGWAGWSHTSAADLFGLGVEGQAYLGSATLYGAVGYGHVDGPVNQNLWTGRIEGRYFVTENFMLAAQAGLVQSRIAGTDTTVRSVGVGAEYQPGALPFSIQGSYTHADASGSSAAGDTLRVGVRWNFDRGTLAERDRLGPSLSNVTDLFQSN